MRRRFDKRAEEVREARSFRRARASVVHHPPLSESDRGGLVHDGIPMALEFFRIANPLTMLADATTHPVRRRSLRAGESSRARAREAKSSWIIESRFGAIRGL